MIFCGRQGIALRGHRDNDSTAADCDGMGNFKALLDFQCQAGHSELHNHLASCAKHASYASNTVQNDLLKCVKDCMEKCIINYVKAESPYNGIQADEMNDAAIWEQLGLVLRYISST